MIGLCVQSNVSASSGFFAGLISQASDVTQRGPAESMSHYYRRSNHRVPSLSLSEHAVSSHLWRKSAAALWTSCSPLSPSRYGTLNPDKFIDEAHLTISSMSKLTGRGEGGEGREGGGHFWINKESWMLSLSAWGLFLCSSRAAGWNAQVKDNNRMTLT